MAEPALHQLERQFEPAVDAPVDAPRCIEVAQRMQASVLRSPVPIGNFGQASFHSRSAFTTIGGSGTVRSPLTWGVRSCDSDKFHYDALFINFDQRDGI